MKKVTPSFYAITPSYVRYDKNLTPNAKLLYGEITALCNEKGYCWANNEYFATLYNVSNRSVSAWISSLVENGHIESELIYKDGTKEVLYRKLIVARNPFFNTAPIEENFNTPIEENFNTPIEENFQDNNTYINNTYNNNNMCVSEKEEKKKGKGKADKNEYTKEFETIWNEYPKRKEKKKAYKAYQARLKENDYSYEQMLDAVKGYAKECKKKKTEEQFIKLPSTFFGPNTNFEDYYQKQTFESGQVKTEKFTSATDYARENNLTLKDIDCPFD